jgi:hypothetical protein
MRMNETETIRRKLLEEGLSMARTGQHTDHQSIFADLQRSSDYWLARYELESPGVRKQFDIVCAEARRKARYAERNRTGVPIPYQMT